MTDGCFVYAAVEPAEALTDAGEAGIGEKVREYREKAWYGSDEYPFLFLTGGPGIGVVTKPGLSCPVGYYALNPVPRAMIFRAAGEVYEEGKLCHTD